MGRTGEVDERFEELLAALRAGRLTPARVEAAAWYGHPAAVLLYPDPPSNGRDVEADYALVPELERLRLGARLAGAALQATSSPPAPVRPGDDVWRLTLEAARSWGRRTVRDALAATGQDARALAQPFAEGAARAAHLSTLARDGCGAAGSISRIFAARCVQAVYVCAAVPVAVQGHPGFRCLTRYFLQAVCWRPPLEKDTATAEGLRAMAYINFLMGQALVGERGSDLFPEHPGLPVDPRPGTGHDESLT